MSTTITAGNATNGLALSADNTGVLELKTGTGAGTTAISISASQVVTGTAGNLMLLSSTVIPTTSGTGPFSFINIPSWVKRITVMFNGVTASASSLLIQIGSGSYSSSGYVGGGVTIATSGVTAQTGITAGLLGSVTLSTGTNNGTIVLTNITGNTWTGTTVASRSDGLSVTYNGTIALGGVLDRVQVTTITGTATFSAGNINILYE
jgi:hypothetical protein